ncbi:MAG: TldD/PmbA family protein [Promethearchaeota archaeon]
MEFEDIIDHGINYGSDKGAKYVEIRAISSKNEAFGVINGEVLSAVTLETTGAGIRVLFDGAMSFVSTANLTRSGIEKAIDTAVRLSRAIHRKKGITLSDEKHYKDKWNVKVKKPFWDIDPDTKAKRFIELDKALIESVDKKVLQNRNSFISLETQDKLIATNEGTWIESETSLGFIYLMLTARTEDSEDSEQRGIGYGGTFGWEWFESENFIKNFVKEAESLDKVIKNAKHHVFNKPIDVIIGPEVAGIMAHENAGHPSEMDRIKGREGAEAGESFWMDIEIGKEQIGSPAVTVIDDPTIESSAGFYKYDDEGVKARPRYLIKDGIINEPLLNRQFASELGVHSNAAARSVAFNREPLIRMANTYIKPGDYSFEELIEDIKLGLFIENFTEWNIDDRRFQSKYVGCVARIIENGELTGKYVKRPVLELTSRGLFSSIDACGKGFHGEFATCGKSNPSQGCPVWMGGPEQGVRMRNIRLGGM